MKLQVSIWEARGLAAADSRGLSDPFVKLKLGPSRARTSVKHKELNPTWVEEFVFVVNNADEELNIEIWDEDFFAHHFLGEVKIPISSVLNAEKHTRHRVWYPLQKRSGSSNIPVSGDICIGLSIFGIELKSSAMSPVDGLLSNPINLSDIAKGRNGEQGEESALSRTSSFGTDSSIEYSNFVDKPASSKQTPHSDSISETNTDDDQVGELGGKWVRGRSSRRNRKWKDAQRLANKISTIFKKPGKHSRDNSPSHSGSSQHSNMSMESSVYSIESASNTDNEDAIAPSFFDNDNEDKLSPSSVEIPLPLSGGVLLDQTYGVSSKALNAILFKPGSTFVRDLVEAQKSTEYMEEPWRKAGNGLMKRVTSYIKAASKLVKALKATEVQTYTRADEMCYCVLSTCATPDAPYGGTFVVEVQITISSRPDFLGGMKCCHLQISYNVNFLQKSMMKGMIEGGVRTGIKETYAIYQDVRTPCRFLPNMCNEFQLQMLKDMLCWGLPRMMRRNPSVLGRKLGTISENGMCYLL